jgi:hypothetical protein
MKKEKPFKGGLLMRAYQNKESRFMSKIKELKLIDWGVRPSITRAVLLEFLV